MERRPGDMDPDEDATAEHETTEEPETEALGETPEHSHKNLEDVVEERREDEGTDGGDS